MGIATNNSWHDELRIKTIIRFLTVFAPMIASFSIFNLWAGNVVVGWLEAFLTITVLGTWRFHSYFDLTKIEHSCIVQVAVLIYAFIFFPAVGDSAYIWAVGFPFFTSYLSGFRSSLKWSLGFGVVSILTGMIAWKIGISLYWPWEIAPYILLAYTTMALFACFFALKIETHIKMLETVKNQAKSHELDLVDSETRYRTLLQSSLNGVAVHRHGKWIYANPACLKLFAAENIDQILGTSIIDYIHPEDQKKVLERIAEMQQGKSSLPFLEEKLLRCNGELFFAEVRATPIVFDNEEAFMVTINDISERKKNELLQREMEHSQRLESLGILAGGIAHDFNNFLAAILGNAELALMKMTPRSEASQHLEIIKDTSNRAATLCQQMLAYAGKGHTQISAINLNDMLLKMGALIRSSISKNINITQDLHKDLPMIEGDSAQLQQVVLNFIVNAAEAIGDSPGAIHIQTGIVDTKTTTFQNNHHLIDIQDGDYAFFEITDTGCGMDDSMVKKIFDPFFSTKDRGSGLGLSAVMGIVRKHQGDILIQSTLDQGTTFKVVLPLQKTPQSINTDKHEFSPDINLKAPILLVDDEPSIRQAAAQMLQQLNVEILEAKDGLQAVNIFESHHQNISVVLMDITMPRLAGIEAMQRMRKIDASIPIILMSGYSDVSIQDLQEDDQPNAFIQKPFEITTLKNAFKSVL